nr:Thymidine kinase [Chlamydiota bacterium]
LLIWAEALIEIKTICHCGSKATMNMRIDEEGKPVRAGEQVHVGGNEKYLSVCMKHFNEMVGSIEDSAFDTTEVE